MSHDNANADRKLDDLQDKKDGSSSSTKDKQAAKQAFAEAAAPDGTHLVGTISYVEDDGIIDPAMVKATRPLVDQATKIALTT